ncbi:MAG: hypothetical protein KDA87_25540 [Planctomycetales bacterium]|nr:hypothetical protein [Planctomycetales bacterium]
MSSDSTNTLLFVLSNGDFDGAGQMIVGLESFLNYDRKMTADLADLVKKWSAQAAPSASRSSSSLRILR